MKVYETREVPASVTKMLTKVVCDICKEDAPNPQFNDPWGRSSYDAGESKIIFKTGSSFPEGGSGTVVELDICPECMEEKVLPAVREMGAVISPKNWDC